MNEGIEELDRQLAEKWISGIWSIPAGARPGYVNPANLISDSETDPRLLPSTDFR